MDARLEQDLAEQLEIAERLVTDGREPTDEERARFMELKAHVESSSASWRERLADTINRWASALESIGM